MSTTEQVTPTAAVVHPSAIGSNAQPNETTQIHPKGRRLETKSMTSTRAETCWESWLWSAVPSRTISGLKEVVKGKITGNQGLVQQGHERQTGELKRKEKEADMNEDPFSKQEIEQNSIQTTVMGQEKMNSMTERMQTAKL
ncbi:hypothetical protein DFS33DRAFT_1278268 [Desarmillaria ectypa]|nr:hypothetical protein DFS33DRAFT_1278268 [Desarmillaria ectypa]